MVDWFEWFMCKLLDWLMTCCDHVLFGCILDFVVGLVVWLGGCFGWTVAWLMV